jgi:hypothetical protein
MHMEHLVLETDKAGNLRGIPKLPPNKQVEVTFSVLDKPKQKPCKHRFPHRDIAGRMQIVGNIFDSVSEIDWDLPK